MRTKAVDMRRRKQLQLSGVEGDLRSEWRVGSAHTRV